MVLPLRNRIVLTAMSGVIVAYALASFVLWREYISAINNATNQVLHRALVLSEHAARSFEGVELMMDAALSRMALTQEGNPEFTPENVKQFKTLIAAVPQIRHLVAIRRDGNDTFSNIGTSRGVNLADRKYFQVQAKSENVGLYIDDPVLGRATGTPFIPVSRRISGSDGRFDGALMGVLDQEYFTTFYDAAEAGSSVSSALVSSNGTLFAFSGDFFSSHADGHLHLPAGFDFSEDNIGVNHGGIYVGNLFDTEEKNIVAFKNISKTPYIIISRISRSQAISAWLEITTLIAVAALAATAALVWLTFSVTRQIGLKERVEEALRTNEQRFRVALGGSPVSVGTIDRDLRYTWFYNPVVGFTPEFMVGKRDDEIGLQPEDATALIEFKQGVLDSGVGAREEFTLRLQEGDSTFDILAEPLRERSGAIIGLTVSSTDITEHKRAEEQLQKLNNELESRVIERTAALRESEGQFRTVVDNLPASIGYYDMDERLQFINKEIVKQLASPVSEIIGKPIRELFSAESYAKLRPRFDVVLAGREIRFEETIKYPDGKNRDIDVAYIPHFDDGGKQKGWFALVQDITERKLLQAELLRNERLAAMGQLTGTVAHELRNPLGAIRTSMYIVEKVADTEDDRFARSVERIDRSITRCDKIITELLDFARAKGLQPRPTALDTWLSVVLKEQHIPEGITVKTNLQTDGAVVHIDPEELRRAMINVVDNACQAMVDGNGENGATAEGELTVASRLNGERVEIEFTDTGPGISEDILPKILEPLFSTKSFGTGLGLPTVQRIMEEHGGGLEVSSEEGRGTQVVLWLPPCGESEKKQKRRPHPGS